MSATTVYLVRHAVHDRVDTILCGRMAGVGLAAAGHRQAACIGHRLHRDGIEAVYTSPLQRARETANYLSPDPRVMDALTEIDFGAWTGRSFMALAADPHWGHWNAARARAAAPDGEDMAAVQRRAVQAMKTLAARHPNGRIAVVSHGEIIRSILMAWLRMTLDCWSQIEISPASISTLAIWDTDQRELHGKVMRMNETIAA